MKTTCDSSKGVCEVQTESSGPTTSQCPCGTDFGGDPFACAMGMWTLSFFEAMKAVQVDFLKAKIQKAWGPKMDKAADAVLEAMGTKWQSMIAQAKAKEDWKSKLSSLWMEK